MIIGSLLTACGQTTSVSEEFAFATSETVISKSVTEIEPERNEENIEEVSAGEVYEEAFQIPEMKETYSDWQEAYADFIEFQAWKDVEESAEFAGRTVEKDDIDWSKDHNSYYMIYVDNDDIPELFISSNSTAGGCTVATYYDGKCTWEYLSDEMSQYIPFGGYLYTDDGKAFVDIKQLEKGQFNTVFFGEYHRFRPNENDEHEEFQYWLLGDENESVSEENSVTEKVFKTAIKRFINIDDSVLPEKEYKYTEVIAALSNGEGSFLLDE